MYIIKYTIKVIIYIFEHNLRNDIQLSNGKYDFILLKVNYRIVYNKTINNKNFIYKTFCYNKFQVSWFT